ncbi:DUF58 domain-containing protein [Thermostilla marina]
MARPKTLKSTWRTRLTRVGWYYLVLAGAVIAAATIRQVNLMLLIGGLVSGPLFLSWWTARANLKRLSVRRRLPREVCVGDPLVVRIDLESGYRLRGVWSVVVEDVLTGPEAGDPELVRGAVLFRYLTPRKRQALSYEARLSRRGRYRVGPVHISTRFPFGLFRVVRTVELPDEVIVFPRIGTLRPDWFPSHHAFEGRTRRETRAHRATGDFFGVREYQQGDSARYIHWRQSVKHGELVVRQFEKPRNRDVVVLLDLHWSDADGERPTEDTKDPVELAVGLTATLIDGLSRRGGAGIALGLGGNKATWIRGPVSSGMLGMAMETLATIQPAERSQLPELLNKAGNGAFAAGEVIVVSTRPVVGEAYDRLMQRVAATVPAPRLRIVDTSQSEVFRFFSPIREETNPRRRQTKSTSSTETKEPEPVAVSSDRDERKP